MWYKNFIKPVQEWIFQEESFFRHTVISSNCVAFFMHSSLQRKYAAKAAHGARRIGREIGVDRRIPAMYDISIGYTFVYQKMAMLYT